MDPSPPASPAICDINQGAGINAANHVLVGLTIVVVAVRFAIRYWIVKDIRWDDWTILLALIGTVIGAAFVSIEVHYGYGTHQSCLTAHQLLEFQKYIFGEWIQTFASLMWTKVSICLFLLRIPISKRLTQPLQWSVVVLIVSNVVLTLCWILQCRPVRAAWDITANGQCFSRGQKQRIIFAQAIISVVSDFAFAGLPILLLWNVRIKLKKKVGICFLMGFGVITGACCIVRTALNYQSITADATYGGIPNWLWRLCEVQFGIMAACIPTLPPGYKWLRRRLSKSKHNSLKAHLLPFAENPANPTTAAFQHRPSPSKPPKAHHHHHHEDHDISHAMRSYESEPPPPPARAARGGLAVPVPNRIQRTIRVDVDVDVERDAVAKDNILKKEEGDDKGKGKEKKPSIEIDLGPRFEIEIESLQRGFCCGGMVLDARAGAGAGAGAGASERKAGGEEGEGGGRSRQASESESEKTLVD